MPDIDTVEFTNLKEILGTLSHSQPQIIRAFEEHYVHDIMTFKAILKSRGRILRYSIFSWIAKIWIDCLRS